MKKFILFILVILLISPLVLISSEYGNSGLFKLFYANSIMKGNYQFSLGLDNIDRQKQDTDINDFYISFGYGLTDNLEIGGRINFLRRVDPDNLKDSYYNGTPYAHEGFYQGVGYADFGLKFSLSDNFAVRGFISMPMSDKDVAVTTTKPAFGGNLIVSTKKSKTGIFSVNLGYTFNGRLNKTDYINYMQKNLTTFVVPTASDILTDEFTFAAGGQYRLSNRVYLIGTALYTKYMNSEANQEDCFDVWAGFQFLLNKNWKINIAYKKNLLFTDGLATSQGGAVSIVYNSVPEAIKEKVVKEVKPIPVIKEEKETPPPPKPVVKPLSFEDTYFAFDSYELTEEAKTILLKEVKDLKAHPELNVVIEGHTCNIGTNAYNLALGEKRAQAVKDFLISNGIEPARFQTISYGEENPKYDNTTEETRRFNRRAYIKKR